MAWILPHMSSMHILLSLSLYPPALQLLALQKLKRNLIVEGKWQHFRAAFLRIATLCMLSSLFFIDIDQF